jgi:anthranilate phosphoribosyltransferase
MSFSTFKEAVQLAATGTPLTGEQMEEAMAFMLEGAAAPVEIATFLTSLKMRGETVEEITAAAKAMRAKATRFDGPTGAIDTCGTGGDGAKTFNISTAVTFVLAACGVPVAKHGNKAVSSASGSSDILSALGVNLQADMPLVEAGLNEDGICFLFAQRHHPAVRHVAPVRAEMGIRTLFNVLGPLTNPAGAPHQLLGVYDKALTEPLAHVLKELGATSAWVVHGSDGLDELTTTGPSFVSALSPDGTVTSFEITPADAGLPENTADQLVGGDAEENAAALRALLANQTAGDEKLDAYRNIVLLNAAAGLVVAGKVAMLGEGARMAEVAIAEGKAQAKLEQLIKRSNS